MKIQFNVLQVTEAPCLMHFHNQEKIVVSEIAFCEDYGTILYMISIGTIVLE